MNDFQIRPSAVRATVRTTVALMAVLLGSAVSAARAAPPIYEDGYANGRLVTISVQDPHPGQTATAARGLYFEVIYPLGWEYLTESIPLCNPCDHLGDGDDIFDYHDHVFSGEPSDPADDTYRPLWQLTLVVPAYTGDLEHDLAVSEAYAQFLPVTSAAQAAELLSATLDDGSPVANWFVEDYVFRAAIVDDNARD